jgi:glycosyltransferase involved in cell wall biosynthesis
MSTKKKLWIVNQYSVTPEYPASSRHYELAKYLSGAFDVTVWGSNYVHHNKSFRFSKWSLLKKEALDGFIFCWLGAVAYKGNSIFRIFNMLLFALWFLIVGIFYRTPDIIVGSSPPLFTAFSCLLIAKLKKAAFVLEVRDLWPDSLIEIGNKHKGLEIHILKWMEKTLYVHADLIIVLTKGIGKKIQDKGVPTHKLVFLPNGIDFKEQLDIGWSQDRRLRYRNENGLGPEDFVFMYAGAHGPANDLEQLIHAMKELEDMQNIKLVLLGEGIEKAKLMQLVKTLGLNNKVIFLPAVPKSRVIDYLTIADAFIICLKDTPLFEGALPNKLFDYLLFDKPIVTTVRGEIEQFLSDCGIGFYGNMKEENEHNLLEVLKRTACGELNLNRKEMTGYEIIKNHYNREKQAEYMAELLNGLLREKKVH